MRQKIKEWIKRYLPAEIVSVIITVLYVLIASYYTDQRIVIALVSTWAGNIGYFGYILVYDIYITNRLLQKDDRQYTRRIFYKNIKALTLEFGIAELLDSLFIRPALMYYIPLWMDNLVAGSIVGKLAADITFYIPAIIGYEWSKKKIRNTI